MSHNQLVFGILLAAIFGLASFLLYRLFFVDPDAASNASVSSDVGQIEDTLKKILSQTATMTPASAPLPAEVEKMKQELETSQKMVEELKTKSAGTSSPDNTPELLAKIKILEDRLAEYEIIEDDIADLSVFKEENAKLKKQLEAIKSGQSSPMVEDFAAAVENAPVGTEVRGESVEEAVAAAEVLTAESAEEPPIPEGGAEEPTGLDDAIAAAMGGFVKEQAKPAAPPAPEAPPLAEAVPVAAAAAPQPAEAPQGTEDVFAEFQGDENKDLLSELGDIDADRMLEEIKDLGEGMSADADVLNEEVDLEKMAKESSSKG